MTKVQGLLPVSLLIKAFRKLIETLIEDEVVVNDIMVQLKTEMENGCEKQPKLLLLKGSGEDVCVVLKDIAWISAAGSYVCFHFIDGRSTMMSGSLKAVLQQLHNKDVDNFVRIHNSHAVNLYHVKARCGNVIYVGKKSLSISNKYKNVFSRYFITINKKVGTNESTTPVQ